MTPLAFLILGAVLGTLASARSSDASGNPYRGALMLSSIRNTLWSGGKRRKVATAVTGVFLVAASSALAAWMVFSGVTGSGGAKAEGSTQTVGAIQMTSAFQDGDTLVSPATPGDVYANLSNPSENTAPAKLLTLTASSITADKAGCTTTGMTFTANPAVVGSSGVTVPPGTSGVKFHIKVGTLTAPANLPTACLGAAFTVNFTGTTS